MAKHFQVDTGGTLLTSLLSYFRMEGDSTDYWGSNNGTDTAITYNSGNGKVNQGAGFNGSTSKITMSGCPITGSGNFSIFVWVKTSSTGARKEIVSSGTQTVTNEGLY